MRETKVEHSRAIGFGVAKKPGFLAVGLAVDDIAGGFQRIGYILTDAVIIFDKQDANGSILLFVAEDFGGAAVDMHFPPPAVGVDPVDLVDRGAILQAEFDAGNGAVDHRLEFVENIGERHHLAALARLLEHIAVVVIGADGCRRDKEEGKNAKNDLSHAEP